MAALSHQSAINLASNFWVSTNQGGETVVAPLRIRNGAGTDAMVLDVGSSNATISLSSGATDVPTISLTKGGTQASNTVSIDVGNLNPVLEATGTTLNINVPLFVNNPAVTPHTAILQPNGIGAELSSTTGFINIGANLEIQDAGAIVVLSQSNQSNIQTTSNILFANTGVFTGGIAQSGTALRVGTTSNTTGLLIDSGGTIQTRGPSVQINDPVSPGSNFINFSNAAGTGYVDLVAGNTLYPQIQFTPSKTILESPTTQFATGPVNATMDSGNILTFVAPSNPSGFSMSLNAGSGQGVITTSGTNAMVVETTGVCSFPQGINISNATLTLSALTVSNAIQCASLNVTSNIVAGQTIRGLSNVYSGWVDTTFRVPSTFIAASAPNPVVTVYEVNPASSCPGLFNAFEVTKLWFPSMFGVTTGGGVNVTFELVSAAGTVNSNVLWSSNVVTVGANKFRVYINRDPTTGDQWNDPTNDVSGAASTYNAGFLAPIVMHKDMYPLRFTAQIADPPNAQNSVTIYNGCSPTPAVPNEGTMPLLLEGLY